MAFRLEPFLWIHLSGLVTVPILLGLCLVGLAIGNPSVPVWLEWSVLVLVGIGPILWMQLVRPFYIFSVLLVSVQPDRLTENQCRMLTRFKGPIGRTMAGLTAVLLAGMLWQLYYLAPAFTNRIPLQPELRPFGLFVAAVAFLLVNLFVQVPVSVLHVLFTQKAAFLETTPYPPEQIRQNFTVPGFLVRQILPPALTGATEMLPTAPSSEARAESSTIQSANLASKDSANS